MKKRLLSIFLVLCMVFTLPPISAMAEEEHTTIGTSEETDEFDSLAEQNIVTEDLDLSETLITKTLDLSDVTEDINCAGDSASHDGHSHSDDNPCWAWYTNGVTVDGKEFTGKVLVLDGVNIVCTADNAGIILPEDTTIVTALGSVNNITAGDNGGGYSYGIYGLGNLTFDGSGILNVRGGTAGGASYGIYGVGNVRIDGGTVNATGATNSGSGGGDTYTVSFDSDGGPAIPPLQISRGGTLTELPISGKRGSVFIGWYKEDTPNNPVGTDTEFYADTTLVARYETITGGELEYTDTTFAQAEAAPSLSFTINASGQTIEQVQAALTLSVLDNSGEITLDVTGTDGSFTVSAKGGFTPGGAYRLTLGSGLNFGGKDEIIRNCEFTIKRSEVFQIEFNDNLNYIPMNNITNITQNGQSVEELNSSLYNLTTEDGGKITKDTGTFRLKSGTLGIGDVVSLYSGEKPEGGDDKGFINDNIAYVKITDIADGVYTYVSAEPEEVLFMPDVLPVSNTADVDGDPNNASIMVSKNIFDYSDTKYADTGLNAATTVDKGDFLSFYVGTYDVGAVMTDYGRVTSVTLAGNFYIVDYEPATIEDIQEALNYYSAHEIDADKLLEQVDVPALEGEIEQQAIDSGFAEAAASYLISTALQTEGFNGAIEDFDPEELYVTLEDGSEVSLARMQAMGYSLTPSFDIKKIKASITTNGKKFGGLQCALEIEFTLTLFNEEFEGIQLTVKASFIEELKMDVNASGTTVVKWKWIFPYIADYQFKADLDVYNYTYFRLDAVVTTKAGTTPTDISEEMERILGLTDEEDIEKGVSELFQIYSDLMDMESDWIKIFEKEISKTDIRLLFNIINVRITTSFVVSVDAKIALGMEFEYLSGDRYCFWLRINERSAGSNTIRLIDQQSSFQFYVMGAIGIRAGISIEIAVGLFSVDLASVGLGAETGAYLRLYGYFYYKTSSKNGAVTSSEYAGALYTEIGVYLDLTFKAQALGGKYQYAPSLFYKEWPILKSGKQRNIFAFTQGDGLTEVKLKGNQMSFQLPVGYFDLLSLDLKEGGISSGSFNEWNTIEITSTNPYVKINGNSVVVEKPNSVRSVDATITVRYKNARLAFTSIPITRTLKVHWDNVTNPYYITFMTGGIPTIVANYEDPITAPADPVREGYTFEGWYTDMTLRNPYQIPATMPGNNILLYGKWAPKEVPYKVEHYKEALKGGNPVLAETENRMSYAYNEIEPAVKNYPGFTSPQKQKVIINTDGSTVIKYIYTRNSYTLTFQPNYNGLPDIVSTLPFGSVIIPPVMAREGYTFNGWGNELASLMPAGNTTYTAQWTTNMYNVEYTVNGVKVVEQSKDYPFGTPLYNPPIPAGSIFFGWYTDAAYKIPFTQTTVPSRDIKLFCKIGVAYKVEHYQENLEKGMYTKIDTETIESKPGAKVIGLLKTDAGFTYNKDIPGTIASGIIPNDDILVLKLFYTRNDYTVEFHGNGSDSAAMESQIFRYGDSQRLTPNSYVKDGYIFVGWNTKADGSGTSYEDETEAIRLVDNTTNSTIDLYGKWMDSSAVAARIGTVTYGSLQNAIDNVRQGQIIKLLRDTQENIRIPDTHIYSFTLDLNNKTLDGGAETTIEHRGKGTLTITDNSAGKGGAVISTMRTSVESNTTWRHGVISLTSYAEDAGDLIIAGGTISANAEGAFEANAIYTKPLNLGISNGQANNSTITITGGTVSARANYPTTIGAKNVNVYGGTISARGSIATAISVHSDGIVTIYGGTISAFGESYFSQVGTALNTNYGKFRILNNSDSSPTIIQGTSNVIRDNGVLEIGEGIKVMASRQYDGSDLEVYDEKNIKEYLYIKVEKDSNFAAANSFVTFGISLMNEIYESTALKEGYGIYGSSITITGGRVTATGDKAMNTEPNLTGYTDYTATASTNPDGLDIVSYDPTDFSTYQYICIEPRTTYYGISLSESGTYNFPIRTEGYMDQTPLTVTVSNTGNKATEELTVVLLGENKDSFTLSTDSILGIEVSDSRTFTVVPNANLAPGTYTATVTVRQNDDIFASFSVSFTVEYIPVVSVSSAAIKISPNKVSYSEGEQLDLTGLVVELHKSDNTVEDVEFTDFNNKGITVSPANHTVLTTDYDKVVITHIASSVSVEQSITVHPFSPNALIGTAAINNSVPRIGDELSGSLISGNNTGVLTFVWKANGVEVGRGVSYIATVEDLGKTITLEIHSSVETGTITSAVTAAVAKKVALSVPKAPTLVSKTQSTVILTANQAYEFSKDGTTWQSSNVFDGLTASTTYMFYQREAETADKSASAASTGFLVTTNSEDNETGNSNGDNNDSSGNNGGSDSNSNIPVPSVKPTRPVTGKIERKATVNKSKTANLLITEKNIADAIVNAKEEATKNGIHAGELTVAIHVTTDGKKAANIIVNLPKTTQQQMISNQIARMELVIDQPNITVGINLAAISEINRQANGDVQLTIIKTDASKLGNTVKKVIGSRPAYDFKISYQKGSKYITDFGSGKVYVSIPYTLSKKESVGNLYTAYVDQNSKVRRVSDSVYDTNSNSIIFTTNHFSVYGVGYTAPSTKYTDIKTHWAKDSIDYSVSRGILTGTTKTAFSPDTAITRSVLVTALGKLAGIDTKKYGKNTFTDIKASSSYRPYIEWAYEKGILKGIQSIVDGKFEPDRAITREEIAVIFTNYAKATKFQLPVTHTEITFSDASAFSNIYKEAIATLQQSGVLMGKKNNKFYPKAKVTRAEASAILYRYVKLMIHPSTTQRWVQNDAGQYMYYQDSKALIGWHDIGSGDIKNTYYFTKDGILVSSKWLKISSKWYYFYTDGSLAKNTKVGSYEVDENGVRK